MPARLTPLLELAREQFGADAVLAFRWADDGTAIVVGSIPSPLATVTGPAGAPLALPLSRQAIDAAGGVLLAVTERSLLADSGVVVERLQGLRELGVRLAVDDFGTGFSSLTYLQRSPFDLLRIDRTFTDVVTTVGERPALASAVIALANALSMRTVAEGIESVAQRDALIALGCSLGQGNLYTKPLAAAAFRE